MKKKKPAPHNLDAATKPPATPKPAKTKTFDSLRSSSRINKKSILIFIVAFAAIGTALLLISRAANPTANIQPENSTVTGPATIGNDSNASGSKYVKFGKAATPPPGGRQKVIAWTGICDVAALNGGSSCGYNSGGITFDTLKQNGIGGYGLSMGHLCGYAPWIGNYFSIVASHGDLYVIVNIADPLPSTNAEWDQYISCFQDLANLAKQNGAKGMGFDAEPYSQPHDTWYRPSMRASNRAHGQTLGAIINGVGDGTAILYPSSDASWPGSYNDVISLENNNCPGESSCYTDNTFPDFVDGLIAGGAEVMHSDASFHWGTQKRGSTWDTATALTVQLTEERFPAAKASIMFWPDNDEGHGFFSPAEIQHAVDMSTKNSTGPVILYHHNMTTGTNVSGWMAWLAAIKAGTGQ